jgi:hypothetical protein
MKTHTEFLEELKQYLKEKAFKFNRGLGYMLGEITVGDDKWMVYADDVIEMIEQFEAQQRKDDKQNN